MSRNNDGFTITELTVVIVLVAIVSTIMYSVFNTSISSYFGLQQDSIMFSELSSGAQRVGTVLRGLTTIESASSDELTLQAYFSPQDSVVSQIHYYLSGDTKKLLADVTPYSASPPSGSLLQNQKKTYTIIDSFYKKAGVSTFEYLDSTGNQIPAPISDLFSVKGIRANLAVPINSPTDLGNKTMTVQVSLRNRKTNL